MTVEEHPINEKEPTLESQKRWWVRFFEWLDKLDRKLPGGCAG
jgi:hypothetical protein